MHGPECLSSPTGNHARVTSLPWFLLLLTCARVCSSASQESFNEGLGTAFSIKLEVEGEGESLEKVVKVFNTPEEALRETSPVEDFDIYFVGHDNDEEKLNVTLAHIAEIFEERWRSGRLLLRRRQHSRAHAASGPGEAPSCRRHKKVNEESLSRACEWMIGGGNVSELEVQKALGEVKYVGRLISNAQDHPNILVQHLGYRLAEWDEVVKDLTVELRLDNPAQVGLRNARRLDMGKGMYFKDTEESGVLRTTYTAYCTVRDEAGQTIHLIYARHQQSVQTFSCENCVSFEGRTFTVLPTAPPHKIMAERGMKDYAFEVPPGWKICDASAADWERVVQNVIRPHGWGAYLILAQKGLQWPAWRSSTAGNVAGERATEDINWLSYNQDHKHYKFTEHSARLLIEKTDKASVQREWRRYVQLSAQAEWSSFLGLPAQAHAEES